MKGLDNVKKRVAAFPAKPSKCPRCIAYSKHVHEIMGRIYRAQSFDISLDDILPAPSPGCPSCNSSRDPEVDAETLAIINRSAERADMVERPRIWDTPEYDD